MSLTTSQSHYNSPLAEQELVSSLSWLITTRWLAGLGVLLFTWIAAGLLDVSIPLLPLTGLGVVILGYNVILWLRLRQLNDRPNEPNAAYQQLARVLIGLDWLATAVLVYLTGGIESPILFFFPLHIIVASILLPHDRGFLYVTLAPILAGGIALLEFWGILPHVSVFPLPRDSHPLFIVGRLTIFTVSCYATAYISMTLSRRLRRREDQLAALHGSLQVTTSTLDLPQVFDKLAEATAQALHCKAAAIRILDKTGSHLEITSTYGLSQTYLDKVAIEVARVPIDQEALSGQTVLIPDAALDARIRYPARIAAEGIHTILSTPLPGKSGAIGVLRAYGGPGHRFNEDDAAFLSAIAAQGSVAIENAQAYQLLEDLDKQKSQFVRIVTHELRSPVQVAGSLLNVLGGGYVGELTEEQANLVDRAQRRIKFLQTLVDDLLDLAAGRADVLASSERGIVSLNETLQFVWDRYHIPANEKGLSFDFECPDEQLSVWGDKAELDRMLGNLISNAVKYTQEGAVRLAAVRINDSAKITVSDTGIGIPEDALPTLFQEFFRAKNAKGLDEAGTGLGLSIVKDLVERYGGEIEVDTAENQGTTFTVTLPLADSPAHS